MDVITYSCPILMLVKGAPEMYPWFWWSLIARNVLYASSTYCTFAIAPNKVNISMV